MSQNIIVTLLTVFFYISSMLGGNTNQTQPSNHPLQPSTNNQVSTIAGQRGVVLGDRVTLRQGPSTNNQPITALAKGDQVVLLDQEDGWYKVRLTNGQTGWIAGYLLEVGQTQTRRPDTQGKTVMGYYMLANPSYNSMLEHGESLTSIAPWTWSMDSYGGLHSNFDANQLGQALHFAGNQGLDTYALIHNYTNNSFDSRTVSAMLNSPSARQRAITQIQQTLRDWGMSGVNLDFENVPASDRAVLTEFVAELASKLRADGLKITMAVPAKTEDNNGSDFSGAYDYAALGQHLDGLVIMAYDQHYRNGDPGPVASVQWVESVLKYATNLVDSEKIVLGIPAYGYDWPASGSGRSLTYSQAMELAAKRGASVRWHSAHRVPYFEYGNGNQVWFENRYSIKYKADLANKFNLAGVALWRLGQEDPGIWQVLDETLN